LLQKIVFYSEKVKKTIKSINGGEKKEGSGSGAVAT